MSTHDKNEGYITKRKIPKKSLSILCKARLSNTVNKYSFMKCYFLNGLDMKNYDRMKHGLMFAHEPIDVS